MKSNDGCWRRRLAVLVIAASWLTGCATAGFEANGVAACPPVVEYSREFQARAAEELALLPDGSTIRLTGQNQCRHIRVDVPDSEPRNPLDEPKGRQTANAISRHI